MDITSIYEQLQNCTKDSKIILNEPMYKHTTFKIGGNADIFIKTSSIEDVKSIIKISKVNNVPIFIIGNGSNLLVKDKGIRGIVLLLEMSNYIIEENNNKYVVKVETGMKLAMLARKLLEKEISGFEFASGIPGTIGGAVRMNAGAHGSEMKNIIIQTKCMDLEGNIFYLNKEEQKFEYRSSIFKTRKDYIILETTLELEKGNKEQIKQKIDEYATYRKEKQPINLPSAGSTFKRGNNYITAKLIDECNLKGYSIGDAKISELHAGFIVNTGNATASDVIKLIEYTKNKVFEKFNEKLETEIEIIGE